MKVLFCSLLVVYLYRIKQLKTIIMKILKNKQEITSKNLKEQNCDYKGFRLGFDKEDNIYFVGSWFKSARTEFQTMEDLKYSF